MSIGIRSVEVMARAYHRPASELDADALLQDGGTLGHGHHEVGIVNEPSGLGGPDHTNGGRGRHRGTSSSLGRPNREPKKVGDFRFSSGAGFSEAPDVPGR
jgi:hypothetical protein